MEIEQILVRIARDAVRTFSAVTAARARQAAASRPAPLAGVPFAVKNLIDVGTADARRLEDQP